MDNKFDKVICEAVECKEPYEIEDVYNEWKVCSFFGYHFGCGLYFERQTDGLTVGWGQYDNEVYMEGSGIETKSVKMVETELLIPSEYEVEEAINSFNIEDFPIDKFKIYLTQLITDIKENYPIYWDKFHQENKEPVMESVPKENLKDCYKVLDEYVQKLGFEPYREADWNVSYRKGDCTNYIYYIHFTPVMDEDQLKLAIYKDTKLVEQDVWTVQDVEDIKKAFDELIISKIEGME